MRLLAQASPRQENGENGYRFRLTTILALFTHLSLTRQV